MSGNKGVVFALFGVWKTAQTVHLAVVLKGVAAACEHLVPVGLMTHVPHDSVVWGVEHIVQRNREINRSHARGKMPGIHRQLFDEKTPQLTAHLGQRLHWQCSQINGAVDLRQ